MAEKKKQGFLKGIRGEFNKIVWPSKKTTSRSVITVIVVVGILGGIVAALDAGYQYLIFDLLLENL